MSCIHKLYIFVRLRSQFIVLFPSKGNTAQSSLSYWSLVRLTLNNIFSMTSGVAEDAKFSLCCFAILISVATVDSCSNIKQGI